MVFDSSVLPSKFASGTLTNQLRFSVLSYAWFQRWKAGPHPWAIEKFASVAKYPSGQIIAQDLFTSGAIKSATDFQIYKEVTGLSGLDFAYLDNTAVYHTKNDKLGLLKSGSLQHLGDNMLAFLLHIGSSSYIPKGNSVEEDKFSHGSAIYFDILGQYMIVYHKHFAKMLHNSVILQSVLIWTTSLVMGGYPATVSLALSCLSIFLMWIFSIGFSVIVALILPLISSLPLPYVASPWLVVGLFVSPALLGALTGQHLGYIILQAYLSSVYSKREKLAEVILADLVKLEAERWLFKAGFVQWFVLLTVGTYYEIGSSYMALVWLLSPAFAYGLLEATLTPVRFPRPLKLATLVMGLAVPILISSGILIQLSGTVIGMVVRFDRNPGVTPEWMGNVIVAVFIASIICLTGVYLLSYAHLSGTKRSIVAALCVMLGLSLAMVSSGIVPSFTEDTSRAVNVVHVVDSTWKSGEQQNPSSFVSLFSNSPGKLTKEVEEMKEGLVCGRDKVVDFVTFSVKYGCLTYDDAEIGWTESDIPKMHVYSDTKGDGRVTQVSIDTKGSTRWSLAINTDEIEDFSFEEDMEVLVPLDNKVGVDGWHIIQFSGGKNSPTSFGLKLMWATNFTRQSQKVVDRPLLKLRTDINRVTPKAERVLAKLPRWCSLFGKSTSPFTLAFLTSLHVDN